MSNATITTNRVKKLKSRTVFQVDVENLKLNVTSKNPY